MANVTDAESALIEAYGKVEQVMEEVRRTWMQPITDMLQQMQEEQAAMMWSNLPESVRAQLRVSAPEGSAKLDKLTGGKHAA